MTCGEIDTIKRLAMTGVRTDMYEPRTSSEARLSGPPTLMYVVGSTKGTTICSEKDEQYAIVTVKLAMSSIVDRDSHLNIM